MLPLWIIDLTHSPDRRARFLELLGQTNHVFFSKQEGNVTDDEYCWLYTHYKTPSEDFSFDLSDLNDDQVRVVAERVYAFQNKMVEDGQEYVKMIRHSSLRAYTSLNVCVLGDATEPLTQMVFSSIALLLQKEKGRMLANHVHQGMSIIGALCVPSSINSYVVQERERLLRTLMEVDVQHQVSTIRGYDHMLLYQDVQNRVDKYYTLLDEKGQAEFLYQCLIHLYYASNSQHPLISGVAAADSFYLSMGAASVFFDDSYQDKEVSCEVANNLLDHFYSLPKNDELTLNESERLSKKMFLPFDSISIERVLKTFVPGHIVLDDTLPSPFPDPLANFADKRLKRRYFNHYLLNRLAEFRRLMGDEIEKATRDKLEWVHATFNKSIGTLQNLQFPDGIRRFIERCNSSDGGLFWLESQLKNLRDKAGEERKRIPQYVENYVWNNVYQVVEKKYSDAFHDYHSAYEQDLSSKTVGHYCDDVKAATVENLCNHLKQETPIISRVVRAFLLGIVCVLFVLPVLNYLSPHVINLGNIRRTAFPWAVVVFMIPALIELFYAIRYLIKRTRKENKLHAFYLHDAYARIANRIVAESNNYYDMVMRLCDLYLQRSETIRAEINEVTVPAKMKDELPVTQFNQPLVEGRFRGNKLLGTESLEPKMISINHVQKDAKELYPDDYFSLIHLLKDDFRSLFAGIMIPEQHPVEKEKSGTVRLLTTEEVNSAREKEWAGIRDRFLERLPMLIEVELVPLHYPSACGMLMQYYDRTNDTSVVRPFIRYAATNGEFVTSADREQVDVKTQDDKLKELIRYYLPEDTVYQMEPGGDDQESKETAELFKKYIFLTRWNAYESLALNRILPMEDFDIEEQKRQVNEEQRSGKKKAGNTEAEDEYPIATSSVILWSLCEGDNSIHWLKLFHSLALVNARRLGTIINLKLTTKD